MKLTMIKKWVGKYRPSKADFKVLIRTDSINEIFRQMYNHKEEADHFVIEYGFNNTQIVPATDLI